jgi:hypothetical protein
MDKTLGKPEASMYARGALSSARSYRNLLNLAWEKGRPACAGRPFIVKAAPGPNPT